MREARRLPCIQPNSTLPPQRRKIWKLKIQTTVSLVPKCSNEILTVLNETKRGSLVRKGDGLSYVSGRQVGNAFDLDRRKPMIIERKRRRPGTIPAGAKATVIGGHERPRRTGSSIQTLFHVVTVAMHLLICTSSIRTTESFSHQRMVTPTLRSLGRDGTRLKWRRQRLVVSDDDKGYLARKTSVPSFALHVSSTANTAFSSQDRSWSNNSNSDMENDAIIRQLDEWTELVAALTKQLKFQEAFAIVQQAFSFIEKVKTTTKAERKLLSERVDAVAQTFNNIALAPPYKSHSPKQRRTTRLRIELGTHAIQLQFASNSLVYPYNHVPKRTLLMALKGLTALTVVDNGDEDDFTREFGVNQPSLSPDTAFRILQRLVTGMGVRTRQAPFIAEADFNMVLNAYANAGRMDMAHRIIALQERTVHAPPLSPVTYSILLKGYGRLSDVHHVDEVIRHAERNGIEPDTVMANTMIDAYIECNKIDMAKLVFNRMLDDSDESIFSNMEFPKANSRTYNTMLKGLIQAQAPLEETFNLAYEMQESNLWDHVTTNSLVQAAVVSRDFARAEQILDEHTVLNYNTNRRRGGHPNVEAYTQLLDGYAKSMQMDKALQIIRQMRERGVEPNEITYTCLIAGFGRMRNLEQATKTIEHMKAAGISPSCVVYNALISALVREDNEEDRSAQNYVRGTVDDKDMDAALGVFRGMIRSGVRPNAVTVSTLISAMGNCSTPRIKEAKILIETLERGKLINPGNRKIVTALIQICGVGDDLAGALEAFRSLKTPDTMAINAFLEVVCRFGREKVALDTFERYFRSPEAVEGSAKPDVVSYSILISCLMKKTRPDYMRRAQELYEEMKAQDRVYPDNFLVDVVLKSFAKASRSTNLRNDQLRFIASVLRDADQLIWEEGQLERRKRTIRALYGDRLRNALTAQDREILFGPSSRSSYGVDTEEDELFRRKGWNKVDSGFRLWGSHGTPIEQSPRKALKPEPTEEVDQFLESKGWNDVDSGFRIF